MTNATDAIDAVLRHALDHGIIPTKIRVDMETFIKLNDENHTLYNLSDNPDKKSAKIEVITHVELKQRYPLNPVMIIEIY